MTTVNAFDSARQPYTSSSATGSTVPTTSTRGATANRSRSSPLSTPAKIPPSTTTADRCFASNSPMAKPFSRGPRRSIATSPSRAVGVHNPRPRRDVVCTPAAAPVIVDPPHRQTPPPPPAYTLPPHRAGAGRLTTALVRARSAAPLPPHRRPTRRAQPRAARPPLPAAAPAPRSPGARPGDHRRAGRDPSSPCCRVGFRRSRAADPSFPAG